MSTATDSPSVPPNASANTSRSQNIPPRRAEDEGAGESGGAVNYGSRGGGKVNGRYGNPAYKKGYLQQGANGTNANNQEMGVERKRARDNREYRNGNGDRGERGERSYDRRNNGNYNRRTVPTSSSSNDQPSLSPPSSSSSSSHLHQPPVDARIQESMRINEMLGTSSSQQHQPQMSHTEQASVDKLCEMFPKLTKEDALSMLQKAGGDQDAAAAMMTDEHETNQLRWSEVVKKQANKTNARVVSSFDSRRPKERRDRDRPPRNAPAPADENHDAQEHANVQSNAHAHAHANNVHAHANNVHAQSSPPQAQSQPQAQPQPQPQVQPQPPQPPPQQQQQQQHHPQAQFQPPHQPFPQPHHPQHPMQPHPQHQQQMPPHPQYQIPQHQIQLHQPDPFEALHGDDLLVGLGRAIELQLEEIANRSRMLLQMQTELKTIHLTGKDQLNNLIDEKEQLTNQKKELEMELQRVTERLAAVDIEIRKAEDEKNLKLHDLKKKSSSHGLLLTNF